MLHVRKLSLSEIKAIHETHMPEAFPPRELRPYSSIKTLYEGGNYMGYGLFEGEKLAAYAYFAKADGRPFALLDYFAVLPALRGNGLGSRFFTLLCAELEAIDGLLLEVESVESAPDEAQRAVRRRRIAFYTRCGCAMTGVKCLLYGVDYNILAMPVAAAVPPDRTVLAELENVYRTMFDDALYRRVCRPYRSGGA